MTTADYRHQGSGLDANQALTFPLSLSDPTTLDTRVAYDKNDRITGKRSGGISSADSAQYVYQNDSYKLDRVEGRLSPSRDASYYGTFQYDVSGNMLEDRSKGVSLKYGPDGMPTLLRSSHRPPGAGELETLLYPFYDVSGQRVSEVAYPGCIRRSRCTSPARPRAASRRACTRRRTFRRRGATRSIA